MKKVTLVITSSNRYLLLFKTIYSFMQFNQYPIEKWIIIDDSENADFHKKIDQEFGSMFEIICNKPRIGQVAGIDKVYSKVKTPYIFHCEDDWQFYRPGFIEVSMELLEYDAKILQVWLREQNDTNSHPIEPIKLHQKEIEFQRLILGYRGYNGFSFNPGLKRLSDYKLIGSYSSVPYDRTIHTARFYAPEAEIGQFYANLGYRAVILPYGFVRHIGSQARVGWD